MKKYNKNINLPLKIKKVDNCVVAEISTMQNTEKPQKVNVFWLILSGLFIGFVNGFWGGGGGMICVPVLTSLIKLPEKKGHATALLVMLPLCIASFVIYLIKSSIEIGTVINVGVGFVVGGALGALLLKNINNLVLKLLFSLIIIAGGIKMLL